MEKSESINLIHLTKTDNDENKNNTNGDSNQKEIDLIVVNQGEVNLIECKAGMTFSISDVAAFKEIKDDKYVIANSGIVCSTKEPYALGNGYFAVPICSL